MSSISFNSVPNLYPVQNIPAAARNPSPPVPVFTWNAVERTTAVPRPLTSHQFAPWPPVSLYTQSLVNNRLQEIEKRLSSLVYEESLYEEAYAGEVSDLQSKFDAHKRSLASLGEVQAEL